VITNQGNTCFIDTQWERSVTFDIYIFRKGKKISISSLNNIDLAD